jgi:FlaA1/EpsC-like NDP-sugar epimerase
MKLRITDAGVIVAAVATAFLTRFVMESPAAGAAGVPLGTWAVTVIVAATWVVALATFRTRDARIVGVGATEYKLVINASALAFGMLAIGFLLLKVDSARPFFALALPLGVAALLAERWLWRKWLLRQRVRGQYLARAIVVGSRDDVEYVVHQIDAKFGAGYHVVGAALEDAESSIGVTSGGDPVPIVADYAHVATAAQSLGVDAVILARTPPSSAIWAGTWRRPTPSWSSPAGSPTWPDLASTSGRSRVFHSSTSRFRSTTEPSTCSSGLWT